MRGNEPAVKAALYAVANQNFGISGLPCGVFRSGGGIDVNGKEIAVNTSYVLEDNCMGPTIQKAGKVTPEGQAVADAIKEMAEFIQENGVDALEEIYGI